MSAFVPNGRAVEPGRGWSWIAEGFELFRRQPGPWIALIVVALLIFIGLSLVPLLGSLAALVLAPVFAGGFLVAAREEDEGRGVEVGHLFAGFRTRFAILASVGIIYLAITVAVALVAGLATGAGVWALLGGGADPASVAGAGVTVLLALLIMLALLLPVFMALWFAPALVMFHGQPATEAMKASFVACLKNIVPFLLYSVVVLLLAMVASIPFGLGWLVLGPVLAASLYTGYRDIFFEQPSAAPQPGKAQQLNEP
jgi:uncharacterized membrane protein